MTEQKVLVDLKIAMGNGYCGIATENRLVFKMLAQIPQLKPEGLLISSNKRGALTRYKQGRSKLEKIEQANRFFHEALGHEPLLKNKILTALRLGRFVSRKQSRFDLYDVDPIYHQTIWRSVFDKSLKAGDRELILNHTFRFTDLAYHHFWAASYLKKDVYLNTQGYDFALFLEPSPVRVSPGTKKIVRYHDAIPISDPDFTSTIFSQRTFNLLAHDGGECYYVCNSEPTYQALIDIRPELEPWAYVVPSAIQSNYKRVEDHDKLMQIIADRLSPQCVSGERLTVLRESFTEMAPFDYIFNLATLDPRKNQMNLIKAWEQLHARYPQLKLVIAANRGNDWLTKDIERMLKPHVESGRVIHLANLSVEDIPYLFSHAKAFVFPSFAEGFGLPPLEAMQCECPALVSDIPAHRWVMGEAAVYCDPYSPEEMADKLEQVLYANTASQLRQTLVRRGLDRIKLYVPEVLKDKWDEFFANVR